MDENQPDDNATTEAVERWKRLIWPKPADVLPYKGRTAYDAGAFYCPYVPLQLIRSQGPPLKKHEGNVKFTTRYGMLTMGYRNVIHVHTA